MKIIYISSSTIPSRTANSIHVMKMCQAFQQNGNAIELLAPQRNTSNGLNNHQDIWTHYGIRNTFPIRWIQYSQTLRLYHYAVKSGVYAYKANPQLVLTRNLPAAAVTAGLGLPTICELHQPPPKNLGIRLLAMGRGFLKIVVISKALKMALLERFKNNLLGDQILVSPDAVDLECFRNLPDAPTARKKLNLLQKSPTIGYAGHFYKGRGIKVILKLAAHFPKLQFILMGGNDSDIEKYVHESQRMGLKNVQFLGFIPNAELPLHLAACDALLMPYQDKISGSSGGDISSWLSPMKMFEYMAARRVIIASNLPVFHEVLNEKNAMFCQPDNLDDWVKALSQVIQNKKQVEELAEQAWKDVLQFSWEKRAIRIIENLEKKAE